MASKSSPARTEATQRKGIITSSSSSSSNTNTNTRTRTTKARSHPNKHMLRTPMLPAPLAKAILLAATWVPEDFTFLPLHLDRPIRLRQAMAFSPIRHR
ncbi:hypothetical protein GGI11_005068, partial [Coemansia sp. RSA 2049]